jgi:hypothetical protein
MGLLDMQNLNGEGFSDGYKFPPNNFFLLSLKVSHEALKVSRVLHVEVHFFFLNAI